jgi:hypothetical protein
MAAGVTCLTVTGGALIEVIFWFISPIKGKYLGAIGMIALRR